MRGFGNYIIFRSKLWEFYVFNYSMSRVSFSIWAEHWDWVWGVSELVALFGEVWVTQSYQRKYITGGGFWSFKSSRHYQFALLCAQDWGSELSTSCSCLHICPLVPRLPATIGSYPLELQFHISFFFRKFPWSRSFIRATEKRNNILFYLWKV